ncbi:MAG: hypothetical protein EBT79_06235, partial [Actinobacteria bacterium]|nr:hypothetical protein [Actinomycetota bacterium]
MNPARHRRPLVALAAALVAASVMVGTNAGAATTTVTIKAKLAAGYRMLAVTKTGKAYMGTSSKGSVTLSGMSKADTNAMTISVVSTSGAYVGPVMLKYMASAKTQATTISKAKSGFTAMKQVAKAGTVDLGTVAVKGNYAYTNVKKPVVAVTGKAVAVSGGVPPARENLGKTKVQGASVSAFADPVDNPAGGDADGDGLPAFVDVDDDNDGRIDLVDDAFYSTPAKSDGSQFGEAVIKTGLICGGECVNLNAFNIDRPGDNATASSRLAKMINTFQGVFFDFNSTAKYFPSRTGANFGYFNVDCTGISWCSGSTSRAVTISPDYDDPARPQPQSNALPLASGSTNYADFCGSKVIARNPLNPSAPPSGWPSDAAYDQTMDEWIFASCDPDNDGLPNIIPSKGTIATGQSWSNEIKPRMPGPDGMKVGDTIRYKFTDQSGKLVASSSQVISGVIQTAPSIRSFQIGTNPAVTLHAPDGTYAIPNDLKNPGADTVTLTFWRPQRAPIGTESSWQDVGGLFYSVSGPKGSCRVTAASTSSGAVLNVADVQRGDMTFSVVTDSAQDAAPDPA